MMEKGSRRGNPLKGETAVLNAGQAEREKMTKLTLLGRQGFYAWYGLLSDWQYTIFIKVNN